MKKHLSLAVLALVPVLAAGVVQAQDYFFTNFAFGNHDYALPPAPCLSQHPTMPMIYDGSAWMVYTCDDGRTIARRFFHPIDPTHVGGDGGVLVPLMAPPATPSCDATVMIGATRMNECEWRAKYPVRQ